MSTAAHLIAWTISLLALGGAAVRIASLVAPRGLERVVAAAPLLGALAVAETLLLATVSLGSDTAVLAGAAVVTWLVVRWRVPAPVRPLIGDAVGSLSRMGRGEVVALGAAGGLLAFLTVWALRHPSVGLDASIYHYVDVNVWIHNGRPGSVVPISYDYPFGNYPLTNEVWLTWNAALARSWVPLSLWAAAAFPLAGCGLWLAARTLGAGRLAAASVVALLLCIPYLSIQLAEPLTDVPLLAWLACAVALALRSRERPGLLVPAIVAGGLAVGTKTPALMPALVTLVVFLWVGRRHLRRLRVPLLAAAGLAIVVGAPWYVRNLVSHGSPFWPFVATSWGDPVPPLMKDTLGFSFLQRPAETLRASGPGILDRGLAGGVVVLVVGILGGLLDRRREVLILSGTALLALLLWLGVPGSGVPDPPVFLVAEWPISTSRYVVPGIGAAALALATMSARITWPGRGALVVLVGCAGWNVVVTFTRGLPWVPSVSRSVGAALAGAVLAGLALWAVQRVRRRPPSFARPVRAVAAVLLAVLIALGLVRATDTYVERSAAVTQSSSPGHVPSVYGTTLYSYFLAQPEWKHGHDPLFWAARSMIAQFAGDHFEHDFRLIPAFERCSVARPLAREGWVVAAPEWWFRNFTGVRDFPVTRCFLKGRLFPRAIESGYSVFRIPPGTPG